MSVEDRRGRADGAMLMVHGLIDFGALGGRALYLGMQGGLIHDLLDHLRCRTRHPSLAPLVDERLLARWAEAGPVVLPEMFDRLAELADRAWPDGAIILAVSTPVPDGVLDRRLWSWAYTGFVAGRTYGEALEHALDWASAQGQREPRP